MDRSKTYGSAVGRLRALFDGRPDPWDLAELTDSGKILGIVKAAIDEHDALARSADERIAAAVAEERKRIIDKLDRWGQEAHDTGMLPEAATLRDAAAQLRFESAR